VVSLSSMDTSPPTTRYPMPLALKSLVEHTRSSGFQRSPITVLQRCWESQREYSGEPSDHGSPASLCSQAVSRNADQVHCTTQIETHNYVVTRPCCPRLILCIAPGAMYRTRPYGRSLIKCGSHADSMHQPVGSSSIGNPSGYSSSLPS
jgi:hypothetical protein